MSRTIRAVIGIIFVLVITFSAINICQNIGRSLKVDVTEEKLYTLSDGTKAILAKLNQPIKVKLYYAKTAALKAADQIQYFNNYYQYVKDLLEEYVAAANGMIDFGVIDPRPYSAEEAEALRHGLDKFPITREENFFFGLVVQTQFGVEKAITFFTPDRQRFVEYDISYLIDTAITRQRRKIGILSSLPVMGDEVSGYMAQMMQMQGQRPRPAWTIVEQLKEHYEVSGIAADVNEIRDIDILLVIHPKELSEQTLFAMDQFVLKGGRTVVCVDPYCYADQPGQMAMSGGYTQSSELNTLLSAWGLEMPESSFAGDRSRALEARLPSRPNDRAQQIIGFLELQPPECFNADNVISAALNQVTVFFAGALKELAGPNDVEKIPLVTTTSKGNVLSVRSPYELTMLDPKQLMDRFVDGTEPVAMGYLVTGKFVSAFPEGIEIETETKSEDPNESGTVRKRAIGLTKATEDCAVVVFSDVDFMSDALAYREFIFGSRIVVGDNSALMLNAIEDLTGSGDLISIRSRGNFEQPFVVVDEIEKRAEAETAEEEAKINAEISGFQNELGAIMASAKEGEEEIIGSTILAKKKELELKIRQAQSQLNDIKMKRRERTEHLGNVLRAFNMLMAPGVILLVAVVLGLYRSVRRRRYISHASDV